MKKTNRDSDPFDKPSENWKGGLEYQALSSEDFDSTGQFGSYSTAELGGAASD